MVAIAARFGASLLFVTVLLGFILMLKRGLQRQLSVACQYKLWYLVFLLLALPFFPLHSVLAQTSGKFFRGISLTAFSSPQGEAASNIPWEASGWQNDFTVSVNRFLPEQTAELLILLWLAGILFVLAFIIYGSLKLYRTKKVLLPATEGLNAILRECTDEMGIYQEIEMRRGRNIKSPVIFGLFRPCILLPYAIEEMMPPQEIKFIVCHELSHYKNKDIFMNYVVCLFTALYWFHPLVWFAFRQLREEREIFCDRRVLDTAAGNCIKAYGMTILHFMEKRNAGLLLSTAADMGGTKRQMKKRIEKIAAYSRESLWLKFKSILVFFSIFLMIIAQAPSICAVAGSRGAVFDTAQTVYENFSAFFQGFQGSFVLYDKNNGIYTVYNEKDAENRVSPDSTYKIYSALIALEEKVITPEASVLKWDKTIYPIEEWNRNQNLDTAMQYSANWYFHALNKQVGFSKEQEYLRDIEYGNCDFSGGEDRFWLESSLKISPLEQVMLLDKFHSGSLGFQKAYTDSVKQAIALSDNGEAALYGKTGSGDINGEIRNGWFVGYVEKEENTYFFACHITGEDNAGGSMASQIALSILAEKDIYH